MGSPATIELGKNPTFSIQFKDGSGAACDATGNVTYIVYEDENSTGILSGTMTKMGSLTGFYTEQIACTTANGFEIDKSYSIRILATIDGIIVPTVYTFLCTAATLDWLKNVMEGDSYIDTTTTPWQLVIHKKGDANTEYIRKDLFDKTGSNLTSELVVVGQQKEPE